MTTTAAIGDHLGLLDKERIIAPADYNRWLVPPAALAIHLCIGMAYGFSVFWLPLGRAIGIAEGLDKAVPCPGDATTFWGNAEAIAAIDMCVVPTLTFDLLFAFLVLGHGRRQLLWFQVTRHPTAEWLARQITEAFPWTSAPAYLVRDNDYAYGHVFTSRVSAMGIRDRPITPGSPWQNGCAERLIGTLRRECLDQMVIFSEMHLRRTLFAYAAYYNQARTHLALQKDAPLHRAVQRSGAIVALPILAGLHHQYVRM